MSFGALVRAWEGIDLRSDAEVAESEGCVALWPGEFMGKRDAIRCVRGVGHLLDGVPHHNPVVPVTWRRPMCGWHDNTGRVD